MSIREKVQIENVEQAYQLIAREILAFVAERLWDEAGGRYGLLDGSIGSSWWRKKDDVVDERGQHPPREVSYAANDAATYLRDDLLRMTGDRIWGLTFTLFPTGKFKIEYDYNKPEGYEETDETINLGDAVDRLQKLGVEVEVTHKKN